MAVSFAFPCVPDTGVPVLVGFSGGLDSTVLLHWLANAPPQRVHGLEAIHVHHGLHEHADAWSAHCAAFCAPRDIPLHVVRVQVYHDGGRGLEAAAREARRAAFAQIVQDGQYLALAHHRDDQAETWLLRALRGSGDGLAAMRPLTPFAAGQLWRPLLALSRAQLLDYAQRHGLDWIEDPSNADPHHDRNFLRLHVLPLLHQRWPQAAAVLARNAALAAANGDLLDAEDAALLPELLDPDGALDIIGLYAQPLARRARLLRAWCARAGAPPLPERGVHIIERDLLPAGHDSAACFAWCHTEIRRWCLRLYLHRPPPAWPRDWQAVWSGTAPLSLPDGGQLRLDSINQHVVPGFGRPLCVRARRGGERLVLPGRTHSHLLKHLLQEAGIPPWRRTSMPLLCEGEHILAAGDRFLAAPLVTWLNAHGLKLCWESSNNTLI
ncbi:MAG TPA: tRNA lysidine(34) synthetase TilS [Xylella sp.]